MSAENTFKATHKIIGNANSNFSFSVGTLVQSIGGEYYKNEHGVVMSVEVEHLKELKK